MRTELNLTIQLLDDVERTVRGYVATAQKKGHHPTIHGIYGYIRSQDRYSFAGDYPLLHEVLVALKNLGMPVRRSTLVSCIHRHCDDLRGRFVGRKDIVNQLLI